MLTFQLNFNLVSLWCCFDQGMAIPIVRNGSFAISRRKGYTSRDRVDLGTVELATLGVAFLYLPNWSLWEWSNLRVDVYV